MALHCFKKKNTSPVNVDIFFWRVGLRWGAYCEKIRNKKQGIEFIFFFSFLFLLAWVSEWIGIGISAVQMLKKTRMRKRDGKHKAKWDVKQRLGNGSEDKI